MRELMDFARQPVGRLLATLVAAVLVYLGFKFCIHAYKVKYLIGYSAAENYGPWMVAAIVALSYGAKRGVIVGLVLSTCELLSMCSGPAIH